MNGKSSSSGSSWCWWCSSALWLFAPDVLFGGRGYVIGTIVAALVIGAGGFLWAALRKR